jgi:hypothetical protein
MLPSGSGDQLCSPLFALLSGAWRPKGFWLVDALSSLYSRCKKTYTNDFCFFHFFVETGHILAIQNKTQSHIYLSIYHLSIYLCIIYVIS